MTSGFRAFQRSKLIDFVAHKAFARARFAPHAWTVQREIEKLKDLDSFETAEVSAITKKVMREYQKEVTFPMNMTPENRAIPTKKQLEQRKINKNPDQKVEEKAKVKSDEKVDERVKAKSEKRMNEQVKAKPNERAKEELETKRQKAENRVVKDK